MRLCGFNLGNFVMFICRGCYPIIKDVTTFVVKSAQTFFREFNCFHLLLFRSKSAEGRDCRLCSFQYAEVIFVVEMFQDVAPRNTVRGKFRFTIGKEDDVHFGTKSNKFMGCQTRTFVLHLAQDLGIRPCVEGWWTGQSNVSYASKLPAISLYRS